MFFPLTSLPKNYDWGTPGALSRFTGQPTSDTPEAELWFGPHPLASCCLHSDTGEIDFSEWLSSSEASFPLLVKLLAADQPLSIQVHPTMEQAVQGYEQDERAGLALSDPQRTYKDPYPKPEMLIALSDEFDVLWGLLPRQQFLSRVSDMEQQGLSAQSAAALRALYSHSSAEALTHALRNREETAELAQALVSFATEALSAVGPGAAEVNLISTLHRAHPNDPGIVIALFMHHVTLKRGEAIFVSPGELHAYVRGFGLEVMLPSDNVVRTGLTSKPIDREAFLLIAHREPGEHLPLVTPQLVGGNRVFAPAGAGFRVTQIIKGGGVTLENDGVIIQESEAAKLVGTQHAQSLHAGQVLFLTRDEETLEVDSQGVTWLIEPLS